MKGKIVSNDKYEYRGLIARGWDFLRGDTTKFPDRDYFRKLIKNGGEPSLIVGCGTGRLLLEYLADGFDVEGIDVSPEMLEICKQKAAQQSSKAAVHVMAMESMDLQHRFNSIIVPSCSFQLVPDLATAKEALKRFFGHLLPGGQLVMSLWHILKDGTDEWGDWWQVAEREGFEQGKSLRRWERSRYDSDTQLRHTESRYEIVKDGEVVYSEFHQRSPGTEKLFRNSTHRNAGFIRVLECSSLFRFYERTGNRRRRSFLHNWIESMNASQ